MNIKRIRITKNRDILLKMKPGTEEAEKLKTVIVDAGEGSVKVRSKETRRACLVKDLEEDA